MPTPFPVVGLHLDLKYLMPRKQYLLRYLQEIADNGINTLLLEYEDKFPWVKYPFLQAPGAFTPAELTQFLETARSLGLRVVPLVQTLSHLEFALLHEELAHLRELPDIPTQINPSNPLAIAFIHDLMDEVLAYHEPDEWFHIGADETWFLGTNPDYAAEVKSGGAPAYWARHTRQWVDKLVALGKRPVVWDDVLWRGLERAQVPDFPSQTILAAWDYGITRFKSGLYPQVDVFREAGFEVIGVPCLNWGVLTPRHDHVIQNTEVWAAKAHESGLMGLINSSWASFHTPLPTQMPYVAATTALLQDGLSTIDDDWMSRHLESFFGLPTGPQTDTSLAVALRGLGTNWEQQVGMPRPITPIVWGFMDMMLHYPNGIVDRKKRGGYPLDWNNVDFADVLRQKMEVLRQSPDREALVARLDELQGIYESALNTLQELATAAQLHQQEAQLLAVFAGVKAFWARLVRYLALGESEGEGDPHLLRQEWQAWEAPLMAAMEPFYEPSALQRLRRIYWEPAFIVLGERV